jgi:hypothetical protein
MDNQDQEKSQENLLIGGIVFGITIPIGFYIVVHFGFGLELQRETSSIFVNFLLWILEWIIILVGFGLPWFAWQKLVKPYKDF